MAGILRNLTKIHKSKKDASLELGSEIIYISRINEKNNFSFKGVNFISSRQSVYDDA